MTTSGSSMPLKDAVYQTRELMPRPRSWTTGCTSPTARMGMERDRLLWCVDITKTGDIVPLSSMPIQQPSPLPQRNWWPGGPDCPQGKQNPNSGVIWKYDQFDLNKNGKIRHRADESNDLHVRRHRRPVFVLTFRASRTARMPRPRQVIGVTTWKPPCGARRWRWMARFI
jgi:hypothetical protein